MGGIKTKYTSMNQYHSKKSKIDIPLKKNISVKKAEEIAHFELGSTVILKKIQVGEKIGQYKKPN